MIAKLRIDTKTDRDAMILALANSGRAVWIEQRRENFKFKCYVVCFILEDDEKEAEDERI